VNIGIEIERDSSPATYLWKSRQEFPSFAGVSVVAAIEAGIALEHWQLERARRSWRKVLRAAERAGRDARRKGVPTRGLVSQAGRVLEAVETVLFDGRLPSDLAARAARTAAKMCARVIERALHAYWEEVPQA
jgi:hypothetical protein